MIIDVSKVLRNITCVKSQGIFAVINNREKTIEFYFKTEEKKKTKRPFFRLSSPESENLLKRAAFVQEKYDIAPSDYVLDVFHTQYSN